MKKTIFKSIFLVVISMVMLSMVVTAVLLYTQLGAYFRNSVHENLMNRAMEISEVSAYVIDAVDNDKERIFVKEIVKIAGTENGQGIIVTNTDGEVIATAGFEKGDIGGAKLKRETIVKSFYGEGIYGEGNLGGFLRNRLLYTVAPLKTREGIAGAVIVCSTDLYVRNMQFDVMMRFLWVVIFVILLTLFVSTFLAKRIARPIREITVAAKKIAAGDFTQRVNPEAEGELGVLAASFNQMSVALSEMDDMQSSFISDVSHELRTPMTIISGFVDGVLDGTIPEEEHKKYLEIVLSEIKRLNRLVNDLLEMSRLNSGKIEYKMVPFDIAENVRKAIIAFEQSLSEKDIDVEVDFEDETMFVMGNSDSIYRVITNLMDNAVKFTPEKGYVKLSAATSGDKVKVTVENSGKGLNKRELAHIWDRFYQTDKSRSEKKGVGLGLYIVKNIMKSHNNIIYAESEEGLWTRFIFELDSVKAK